MAILVPSWRRFSSVFLCRCVVHPAIEVLAVEAVAIAPFVLGAVKREVDLHHHVLGPRRLWRIKRNANA
jgi:hypothetical protein